MKKILYTIIFILFACEDPTSENLPLLITVSPTTTVTSTTATINFQASEAVTATVEYGETKALELGKAEMEASAINGQIKITGLSKNKFYYYQVKLKSTEYNKTLATGISGFLTPPSDAPFDGGISQAKNELNTDKTITGYVIDNGSSSPRNIYIQDELSGIQLRLSSGLIFNANKFKVGSKIRVSGNVGQYRKAVQLNVADTNAIELLDGGQIYPQSPISVPVSLAGAVHGRLATFTIHKLETEGRDNWIENSNWDMYDSENDKIVIRINRLSDDRIAVSEADQIQGKSLGTPKKVTGVVYNFGDDLQISPRTIHDIEQ
mgnify:CR=1 FL=1